ncbi:MAG: RagB/SusD family nutrient uptake outer membrane protein, partial [Bacteroidales bacterium]|nr:RagB/SusD family nutrient uptake outer membrane protein [Bacteroidales bacterium]
MKSIVKHTALSLCLAVGLGSCSDFFDLLPLNEIVLESYYTEENDITSVINSCYAGLQSQDCILRMAVWGEFRSDNISEGSGTSNEDVQLLRENILPTTAYAEWAPFYSVINRCNTVMYYAPLVQQRDPNYTESEMRANLAEVKALRALCYFYLIRAYRDVPFVTEPSIDDDVKKYRIAATPFDSIIGFLVTDLEAVKNDAVRRYADKSANTARMTRTGIYALLADLYLWKGDYDACVESCDQVIEAKLNQYNEEVALYGNNTDVELFKEYPLISQHASGSTRSGNTSTRIFGEG